MRRLLLTSTSALIFFALIAGCSSTDPTAAPSANESSDTSNRTVPAGTTATEAMAANYASHDASDDHQWDETDEQKISLTATGTSTTSEAVTVDKTTITITRAGTYRISGTLSDGQIVVNTTDKGVVRLILDDATITSSTTSAIAIMDADIAMIVLADGTTNTLTDPSQYSYPDETTDEPNAALFSTTDMTITGTGALTVTGNSNDGITSKDGLVIASGTITVNAADDGIRGKDYLIVDDGTCTVTSGGDGIKADNDTDETKGYIAVNGGQITVTATADGFDAASDVIVLTGKIDVTSGGGAETKTRSATTSTKGLKGNASVIVDDGTVSVNSSDNALHSNGIVTISGGTLTYATGNDGIHADVNLTITDGTITVTESVEGLEAADILISGGNLNIRATDDGINAASSTNGPMPAGGPGGMDELGNYSLTITGGTVIVDANGDGLDSNGNITMSGGTVMVNGPTNEGNGALDANGTITVSGGTLLAAGSSGMAEAPSAESAQGWLSATFTSVQNAGTVTHVVAADGTALASFTATKDFQSLVYSSDQITAGEPFSLFTGGVNSNATVGGLSFTPDLTGATETMTVTEGEHNGGGMGPGSR